MISRRNAVIGWVVLTTFRLLLRGAIRRRAALRLRTRRRGCAGRWIAVGAGGAAAAAAAAVWWRARGRRHDAPQ